MEGGNERVTSAGGWTKFHEKMLDWTSLHEEREKVVVKKNNIAKNEAER